MGVVVNHRRLPRRVHLGLGYVVEVVFASQATIRDVCDADDNEKLDGCWDNHLGDEGAKSAGIIYIDRSLPRQQKFVTYWHEIGHALLDIRDWALEH